MPERAKEECEKLKKTAASSRRKLDHVILRSTDSFVFHAGFSIFIEQESNIQLSSIIGKISKLLWIFGGYLSSKEIYTDHLMK